MSAEIELRVRETLDAVVVGGLPADVDLDRPLVELGLDSLAMLKLLGEIEKRFGVTFGDDAWSTKSQVTIRVLVEWAGGGEGGGVAVERGEAPSVVTPASTVERARETVRSGAMKVLLRVSHGVAWRLEPVLRVGRTYLLARDLEEPLPPAPTLSGLAFEEMDGEAFARSAPSWAGLRENLVRWSAQESICLLARFEGELVATDWLSPVGDDELSTGLSIRNEPGSCFGLGLFEHPSLKGRGFGLALATHSLHVARARGFRRQTTLVSAKNTAMLAAATHLLGFRRVGSVETVALFGRAHSSWRLGETRSVAQELRL